MPSFKRNNESIWSQLTRLFRSGPVVRHKIASSSKMYQPQGTAKAYKRELSSLYVSSLAAYGQYERLARYADYSEMEYTPEIASALNIYADEVTSPDEKGHMIEIESDNDEIKSVLDTLWFDILNIEFNLHSWVRNLCKYGDFVLFVDANETNGVLNLLPIPINEIEREEGYDEKDPFAIRFRWLTQGNMILENWQIIHFRLLGNDNFLPYGSSIIEPARRIWRQLILIEDAMLVYRIVRSPERRVFKIEVGNIKPEDISKEMEQIQTRLKRSKIVDSTTGRVDLRYNPLSVDEDYWLPVRDGKGSDISTLPGGQFTGDIEDVQYIQSKLFAALQIPKAYLGYEGEVGSKATLAQEDVRFSRTIERVQKIVLSELTKIAVIHLFLLGYRGKDLVDFELKMSNPSTIAMQQKLELWRMKLEIASSAVEGILDRKMVRRDILGLNDRQIDEIIDGQRFDKLVDLELEAMQLPQDEEEELPPGTDELPDTLGGESEMEEPSPGGEEELPGMEPEDIDDMNDDELDSSFIEPELLTDDEFIEVRNPGSEGNDSQIATDFGKDLFSPDEDLYDHVFGTEKQTASDPFDIRASHRLITRPFSEDREQELDPMGEYVNRSLKKNLELDILVEDIERAIKIRGRKR